MPITEEDHANILSDESSFYGDEDETEELEHRASTFDPLNYWKKSHALSPATIAASQQKAENNTHPKKDNIIEEKSRSRHSHDGREECRQLTETIPAFLARLPPSSTSTSTIGPWIFIANHAAPEKGQRVSAFRAVGEDLLHAFEDRVSSLEAKHRKDNSRAALTRKINTERRKLEPQLWQSARDHGVILGKWMLFPYVSQVDENWAAVAGATAKGELGVCAKVATKPEFEGVNDQRLICVYTRDFAEKEDLRRVLVKLKDMGVAIGEKGRPIHYKCDAYTWLDIASGNTWGLKPSMHSSTDILARKW